MLNKIDIKSELQKYWGYDDFRYPQGEIIQTLLTGKDALVIMPTGWGKSLCFQLPALLKTGLTLVVSPLIALMENQVWELREKRLKAALLHSQIDKNKRNQVFHSIVKQQLRLLYLSPETLLSSAVWSVICQPQIEINGLILDEAHCLAQWSESFRPAYRRLGAIRHTLSKLKSNQNQIAIAAFTATADRETQTIIKDSLKLKNPQQFIINPYRQNLKLKIKISWTPKGKKKQLINFIKTHQKQSGLIYVRSRKTSELLANLLQEIGYKNSAYHAGLNALERRKIETKWLKEEIQFVVCTSAFGMGINKSNLRWICHYQAPLLLSEYIQEIGRGGRDGQLTETLTLVSEPTGIFNSEDQKLRQFFLQQLSQKYQKALAISTQIPSSGNLINLQQKFPNYELYLAILNSANQLIWHDPFSYQITNKVTSKSIQNLMARQTKLSQKTKEFLYTKQCRWQFLLHTFGFNQSNNFRCGHCDNCLI